MEYEQTIREGVECSGIGLHSGAPVQMRLLPAPSGTGILFRRTDLDGFEIEAVGHNVAKVSYATSLMRQGVLISTTEHLLSSLYSMGIDNAFIEIDNLEVPILDGSGQPFVDMIRSAGIRTYRRRRRYLRVTRPVSVEGNGKRITILPADRFHVRSSWIRRAKGMSSPLATSRTAMQAETDQYTPTGWKLLATIVGPAAPWWA